MYALLDPLVILGSNLPAFVEKSCGSAQPGLQVALLDSPGIIPAKAVKQSAAYHLAMCNDIGSAAYDTRYVRPQFNFK